MVKHERVMNATRPRMHAHKLGTCRAASSSAESTAEIESPNWNASTINSQRYITEICVITEVIGCDILW